MKSISQVGDVQFAWGARGLAAALPAVDLVVIIDVLSFSTCVDIAVGRGAQVFPFNERGAGAQAYASKRGALLADFHPSDHGYALSPHSLTRIPAGTRLVLPSPNGSTLSLMTGSLATLTGCLRNAAAVAAFAREQGGRVCVVAAGERWPDGSLRPCLEDLLGAGAVLDQLEGGLSVEARAAVASFREGRQDLYDRIRRSVSGIELAGRGRTQDVELACELNVSQVRPLLQEGAYRDASG